MTTTKLPDPSSVTAIDLARLASKDDAEIAKLLQAAEYPGFFYLDFRHSPAAKDIVQKAREVYAAADQYFDQSQEVKAKDIRKEQPASSDRG